MNGKKIACALMMMIVAGIAYGSQIMQKRAKAMLEEAETAESGVSTAKSQREVAETLLKRVEFENRDRRQFLKDWEPSVKQIQTGQEAEQALVSIVRNSGILTVSQKFEVKENKEQKMIPKLLQGTLIVQDEFAKTLNWLGEVERKLPLARVTVCRLKQGETGRQVNLEIQIEIPVINLNTEAPTKK
ncbi:MAG: hypothetical protein ACOYMN_01135 [Roseimicrobium sp.]